MLREKNVLNVRNNLDFTYHDEVSTINFTFYSGNSIWFGCMVGTPNNRVGYTTTLNIRLCCMGTIT